MDQTLHRRKVERVQSDAGDRRAFHLHFPQGERQGMPLIHFIVTVRADQQKRSSARSGKKAAQQAQTRQIGPLEVVNADDERPAVFQEQVDEFLE